MDVLVIGGSGLVGSNVLESGVDAGHDVTGTFHTNDGSTVDRHLDKTSEESVDGVVTEMDPDAIVDTAAFHDVDTCETDRTKAWTVNAEGTQNVAAAAAAVDAHYLYISTDYVFGGNPEDAPYTEGDAVNPVNYYARTKYAGEQAARTASNWTILRTSVVYGLAKPNFVTWALSELRAGEAISIVDDQVSTPTYATDLARACIDVIEAGATGVYHATGPESLSRYEFTRRLADVYGLNPSLVTPISTEEFGQDAPRPADGSLDSSELYDELSWTFAPPTDAFETMNAE